MSFPLRRGPRAAEQHIAQLAVGDEGGELIVRRKRNLAGEAAHWENAGPGENVLARLAGTLHREEVRATRLVSSKPRDELLSLRVSLVRQRRIPLVAAVRLIATSVKPVMSRYLGQTLAHGPLAEVPGPVPGGQNASGLGINRAQRL